MLRSGISQQDYTNSFTFLGTSWTVFEVPLVLEGAANITSPFEVNAAPSTFKFDLQFTFVTESQNALLFLLHPLNVSEGGLAMPPGGRPEPGFVYSSLHIESSITQATNYFAVHYLNLHSLLRVLFNILVRMFM